MKIRERSGSQRMKNRQTRHQRETLNRAAGSALAGGWAAAGPAMITPEPHFPTLLWCLKIALELRRKNTGQILGDWGISSPASKQQLLLTIPQKDWHGMTIPQETQMRHLGAKFVIVPSRESRAFSERQGATISCVQYHGEAAMDLSFLSTTSLASWSPIR